MVKQKASFTFDIERRGITENAYIIAQVLNSSLNPISFNQAVLTPQTRLTVTPKLDYSINAKNTLEGTGSS